MKIDLGGVVFLLAVVGVVAAALYGIGVLVL